MRLPERLNDRLAKEDVVHLLQEEAGLQRDAAGNTWLFALLTKAGREIIYLRREVKLLKDLFPGSSQEVEE